jgi:2-methylisocitrate lyase-like PEP mutase family enzyme
MASSGIVDGGTRLRQLLSDPEKLVVAPGVFDGISARLAIAAGFETIYMVSFLPDLFT